MTYAGWAAMAVGAWDLILAGTWAMEGLAGRDTLIGMAGLGLALAVFGWRLQAEGNEWNAIVVLALYAVDALAPVVLQRDFGGIVWKVVMTGFFIRGLMATVDYHELSEQIEVHPEAAVERMPLSPPVPNREDG